MSDNMNPHVKAILLAIVDEMEGKPAPAGSTEHAVAKEILAGLREKYKDLEKGTVDGKKLLTRIFDEINDADK